MKRFVKGVSCALAVLLLMTAAVTATCSAAIVPSGTGFVTLGDANADGFVNVKDLVHVKKYLGGAEINSLAAADYDADAEVLASDVTTLRKELLGTEFVVETGNWTQGIY